jgi:hypothetical protein
MSPTNTARKLHGRLSSSQAGWTPEEMDQLLSGYGFTRKRNTRHGVLYEHPSHPEWATVIIPRHQQLKSWVGRRVLALVNRLVANEEESRA